jgi:hypothetical protein
MVVAAKVNEYLDKSFSQIEDHKWTNSKNIKFAITDLTASFPSSIVMGKGLGEVKVTFEFTLKSKDGDEVLTNEQNIYIVSLYILTIA